MATVLANIEVLILIHAFGMDQTLGNVLFAVTFLITDILSECEGKRAANRAVWIGIFTSLFFLALSQSWLLYVPGEGDLVIPSIRSIFTNTPRMLLSSLTVYAVSQLLNTFLFTLFAFYGTYDIKTLLSIFVSSYVIYIFTSLLDTPVLYLARKIRPSGE